jgi:hypothetical protein
MKYTQPSFSVPPADLHHGTNRHGQTWDDIFNKPTEYSRDEVRLDASELFCRPFSKGEIANIFRVSPESVPDATGDSTAEHTNATGHTCNGTYKTFSAAHCPYCWSEHAS